MQAYIRSMKPSAMKDVGRYSDYKDEKALRDPKDVANAVMLEVSKLLS